MALPPASTVPAWCFSLAVLLCAALARVSADCGQCSSNICIGGGFLPKRCHCAPSPDNCPVDKIIKETSSAADKADACIATVSGCALDKLKEYLPSLDTQFCETDADKKKFEDGGWKAYYGPRVWDSEAAATLVGLFFPPTSAQAAAKLVRGALARARPLLNWRNCCTRSAPAAGRWTSLRSKATAWSKPCAPRWQTRRTRCAEERRSLGSP